MNSLKDEKIVVLAGGPSCEREVSLVSGKAVHEALCSLGLSARLLDPVGDFIQDLKKDKVSLVFIALHGTFGEDGTVQRMLEEANIPYTGPGPLASESAFHKSKSQKIFKQAQIPVPEFYVMNREDFSASPVSRLAYPVVVKPSAGGSSVGVSIIFSENDFEKACHEAFRVSDDILVERYIKGRELTVGILDDKPLPVVEIVAQRSFYDYEAKYKDSGTRYETPAKIDDSTARLLSETALRAYRALGCEVMSRADFILGEDGGIYLLEMNTIPGLTGKSLLPKAAKAAGIDFPDLCVRILEHSLKKRLMTWSDR